MRSIYSLLSFLLLSFLILSCSSEPKTPCPTDNELISVFKANESSFNNLPSSPNNPELHASLGIKGVNDLSTDSTMFHFSFWFKDYAGPGGCSKGIAYLEIPPKSIVSHIDSNRDIGPPHQGAFYMRINDHWYVYYESYD